MLANLLDVHGVMAVRQRFKTDKTKNQTKQWAEFVAKEKVRQKGKSALRA